MAAKHYRNITRKLQFVKNGPLVHPITITPGWLLMGIRVFLRGAAILSAGTANGTLVGDNPGQLFSRFTVDADPIPGGYYNGGNIVRLTPRSCKLRRKLDRGTVQPDLKTAAGIDGSATTTNLNSIFDINFAFPRLIRPVETALRLDQFANIVLTMNTQDMPSMRAGNDRTQDYSQLFAEVVEIREFAPDYYPEATPYQSDTLAILQAANNRMLLDAELPKTESYIDALIYTETTNQALADTILNRVTAFSGTDQVDDAFGDHLKGFFADSITDQAESALGCYYEPLVQGLTENAGLLNGALPDLKLQLDVSNPGGAGNDRVNVAHRRVSPRKGGPPNKK
jgi:hypothetical protein